LHFIQSDIFDPPCVKQASTTETQELNYLQKNKMSFKAVATCGDVDRGVAKNLFWGGIKF